MTSMLYYEGGQRSCVRPVEDPMASKTPPTSRRAQTTRYEDDPLDRHAPYDCSVASLPLRQVANALGVPTTALYGSSVAVDAAPPDRADLVCHSSGAGCQVLLYACQHIRDPEMRRSIFANVQAAAEREL
jgi:hypothetical protein